MSTETVTNKEIREEADSLRRAKRVQRIEEVEARLRRTERLLILSEHRKDRRAVAALMLARERDHADLAHLTSQS